MKAATHACPLVGGVLVIVALAGRANAQPPAAAVMPGLLTDLVTDEAASGCSVDDSGDGRTRRPCGVGLDEVRRQEFFRAGAVMRRFGRGKRWLLLRRWKTVSGSKRQELRALFAANRRLFKAYVLREELDHLWT